MLKKLKIQNLILIEAAEISFGPHLNILTGETGSGKSAILSAIRLIGGARTEVDLIRNNCQSAIIEAEIKTAQETLLIRREIYLSGKSRCFIDDAQVSLAALKEKVGALIQLVDQSSAHILCSEETQREIIDTFSNLTQKTALFKKAFEEENSCKAKLEELTSQDRAQTMEWAKKDLELIDKINWQKEEEANLNQEHNLLTHHQQLKEKTSASALALNEIPPILKRLCHTLDTAARIDPALHPLYSTIKTANLELEEAASALDSYSDRIEMDPAKLADIEKRMGLIENLRRRFGATWDLVQEKKKKLEAEIENFSLKDQDIFFLQKKLNKLSIENRNLAEEISQLRKEKAPLFAKAITQELLSLNLPHAKVTITIKPKALSASGSDQIELLFSANPGLSPLPIDACASGGELSRLLLAIKTIIAEKENYSCLIFDEIDSNVGGQTASVLGEKLKKLSEQTQVICITHFVQVAKFAQTHFGVYKKEIKGAAVTTIENLMPDKREEEYTRMLGLIEKI